MGSSVPTLKKTGEAGGVGRIGICLSSYPACHTGVCGRVGVGFSRGQLPVFRDLLLKPRPFRDDPGEVPKSYDVEGDFQARMYGSPPLATPQMSLSWWLQGLLRPWAV